MQTPEGMAVGKQVACLLAGEAIRHMLDRKLSMPREEQQVNAHGSLVLPDSPFAGHQQRIWSL